MSEYYRTGFCRHLPRKYSRVLTDNYPLEVLDCGQKIFGGPLDKRPTGNAPEKLSLVWSDGAGQNWFSRQATVRLSSLTTGVAESF